MDEFVRCPQCDDDLPGEDWEQHLGTHGYFKRPDAAPPCSECVARFPAIDGDPDEFDKRRFVEQGGHLIGCSVAPPSDAAQLTEVERLRHALTKPGRDMPVVTESCGCRWLGLWVLPCFEHIQLFAGHDDYADLRGPYIVAYAKEAPHIYMVMRQVAVPFDDGAEWKFCGTERECNAVCGVLNRLKRVEDAPGGPFEVRSSRKAITGACVVAIDDMAGVFYGPKELCEYVRRLLSKPKIKRCTRKAAKRDG